MMGVLIGLSLFVGAGDSPSVEGTQPSIETLVEASQPSVPTAGLIADLANELVIALMSQEEASPMAILQVTTAPDVAAEMGEDLRFAVSAALAKTDVIEEVLCLGCEVISLAGRRGSLSLSFTGMERKTKGRGGGRASVPSSILVVHLHREEDQEAHHMVMTAKLVRAASGEVTMAKRFQANNRRASLAISEQNVETLEERKDRYHSYWARRTTFGHGLLCGLMRIPIATDIGQLWIRGLSLAYRLYDISGYMDAFMFGIQLGGFIDIAFEEQLTQRFNIDLPFHIPLAGGLFTAIAGFTVPLHDLRLPRIRIVGEAGGFFGGSLGNTFAAGGALEIVMKRRLGFRVALLYINESDLSGLFQTRVVLGGRSTMVGVSFNWE